MDRLRPAIALLVAIASTQVTHATEPEVILHQFQGNAYPLLDGATPVAGLLLAGNGAYYGTTYAGGFGEGSIFSLSQTGTLTTFGSGPSPAAPLIQATDGYLYETTLIGSGPYSYQYNRGEILKIAADGSSPTSLYTFTGGADGSYPAAPLLQGADGNFYGTTQGLTSLTGKLGPGLPFSCQGSSCGTVFKLTSSGILSPLHTFTGSDGAYPAGGLVEDSLGNFYGTTAGGGKNGYGTVFKLGADGTFSTLYSFTGGSDGAFPKAGLFRDSRGRFYGTTFGSYTLLPNFPSQCGTPTKSNCGTVFWISSAGKLTTLHQFAGNEGANPSAPIVQASDGYFYGTASEGGKGNGNVFALTKNATPGLGFSVQYVFNPALSSDGGNPVSPIIEGSDGDLYGTASAFGTYGFGNVFKLIKKVGTTPGISLSASSYKVPLGNSFTITWSVVYATTCQSGWYGPNMPMSGSTPISTVGYQPGTYTYAMTCSEPNEPPVTASIQVGIGVQ